MSAPTLKLSMFEMISGSRLSAAICSARLSAEVSVLYFQQTICVNISFGNLGSLESRERSDETPDP
jgi:hypothetical protein